jgi:hypothetical protein
MALNVEPPPGETGRELSSGDAMREFELAIATMIGAPRIRLKATGFSAKRYADDVAITIRFTGHPDVNEVTFRVACSVLEPAHVDLARVLAAHPKGAHRREG